MSERTIPRRCQPCHPDDGVLHYDEKPSHNPDVPSQESIDAMTRDCPGTIRMCGRSATGSVIIATVCQSPLMPAGSRIEPALIERTHTN